MLGLLRRIFHAPSGADASRRTRYSNMMMIHGSDWDRYSAVSTSLLYATKIVNTRTPAMSRVNPCCAKWNSGLAMRYRPTSLQARAASANRQSTSTTVGTSADTGLMLLPQSHDDRYDQQLHEPVTCMNRGHPNRRVLPQDRAGQNDHRKSDPQIEPEAYRARQTGNTQRCPEPGDHVRQQHAPQQLDDQLPARHLRARHRRDGILTPEPHPGLEEQQRAVPQPAQHEHHDGRHQHVQIVHRDHRSVLPFRGLVTRRARLPERSPLLARRRDYEGSRLAQRNDVPALGDEPETVRGQELDAVVTRVIRQVHLLEADNQRLDGAEVDGPDDLVVVALRIDLQQVAVRQAVLAQQARDRDAPHRHRLDVAVGDPVLHQLRLEE